MAEIVDFGRCFDVGDTLSDALAAGMNVVG
jgi:predicted RNase H-like HicB family nuclease